MERNIRKHCIALFILFLIAIVYKSMFFETYYVVNVFTDRLVDRSLFGHELPASVFLSFGSLFTIMLGPIFIYTWAKKKYNLSDPFKFSLSLFIVGIAFGILTIWSSVSEGKISTSYIILFRFLFAISELMILPIGPAIITQYSPKHHTGFFVGAWYLTAAFGAKLAALLANFADIPKTVTSISQMKQLYYNAFQLYTLLNLFLFIFSLALVPFINKLLRAYSYEYPKKST